MNDFSGGPLGLAADFARAEVTALDDEADALEALARARRAKARVIKARLAAVDDGERLVGATEMGAPLPLWRRAIRGGDLRGAKFGRVYLARRVDAIAWIATKLGTTRAPVEAVDVVDLDRERLARGGAIDLDEEDVPDVGSPLVAAGGE